MLNKDWKAQVALGAVLLVMSFVITLQLKSVSQNKETTTLTNMRIDELLTELKSERSKNEELEKKLNDYEKDIAKYREAATATDSYSKVLRTAHKS